MAKNSIRDYSATNSSNSDIQSIDISEGCSPAGINNAIREVMADLKDVSTGAISLETPAADSLTVTGDLTVDTATLKVDSTNNRVGLGTVSPSQTLHLKDETSANIVFEDTTNGIAGYVGPSANNQSDTTADRLGIRGEAGIAFSSGANTLMRMSSGGSLGIGAATDQAIIAAAEPLVVTADGSSVGTNEVAHFAYPQTSGGLYGMRLRQVVTSGVVQHTFATYNNGTEYAQNLVLDRGGVKINTTSVFASNNEKLTILGGSTSQYDACLTMKSGYATGSTSVNGVYFINNAGGLAGYISWNGSSVSYATSSDYRLKTAVNYDWDATSRLKQLKPARFEWIAEGDNAVPVDGFLAHEVQDIVPEAISGTKDAMRDEDYEVTPAVEATYDDDGNILTEAVPAVMGTRSVPDYQGIDQSKIVPILTKALIESVAKIEALEARIAALETA
jgi:hypothetical protein